MKETLAGKAPVFAELTGGMADVVAWYFCRAVSLTLECSYASNAAPLVKREPLPF